MISFKQFIIENNQITEKSWLTRHPGFYTVAGKFVGKNGFPDNLDKSQGYVAVLDINQNSILPKPDHFVKVYFFDKHHHFNRLDGPAAFDSKGNRRWIVSTQTEKFDPTANRIIDTENEKEFWSHPFIIMHHSKLNPEDKKAANSILDI